MSRALAITLLAAAASIWTPIGIHADATGPQRVPALVTGAYDGDTIDVSAEIWPGLTWEGKVRPFGVDTPEIRGKCPEEEAMAVVARDFVRELLVGELVLLADVRHDKYGGRVDAVVLLEDGRDLAGILIAEGLGRPYDGGERASWCE